MKFKAALLAPCGMDCAVCKAYLAFSRGIPKKRGFFYHCAGCRPRGKRCAYLKQSCAKLLKKEIRFCFECESFPCKRLQAIDRRYQTRYNASLIENLRQIQGKGVDRFLKDQETKYRCSKCGGVVSIHDSICYDCYVNQHPP